MHDINYVPPLLLRLHHMLELWLLLYATHESHAAHAHVAHAAYAHAPHATYSAHVPDRANATNTTGDLLLTLGVL
ncbi:unnamed protein product, partial [Iphiclides podalirius]